MDVARLEQWRWDAAGEIRGLLDAPKFKDYILPLVFLKRLSDVFDDEVARPAGEFGSEDAAAQLVEADQGLVRFYIPEAARWSAIATKTAGLGEYLTDVPLRRPRGIGDRAVPPGEAPRRFAAAARPLGSCHRRLDHQHVGSCELRARRHPHHF
ncbi:MAG: type I restriction-modification system subunit M N-terminal domain-containing protein [Acidimicrobiia bacterium]